MAKPTFAEMFIPTVGILMLWNWIAKVIRKENTAGAYFRNCLNMFLCAIPSLLYIGLQFIDYYILGGNNNAETSIIITKWLEVWKMYSENIPLSILLSMAFPLFIIIIDIKYFLTSNMGKLALVGYGVSFLEGALLGEGGEKLSHSNFLWPLMSAMLIVWLVCTIRLLALEHLGTKTKVQGILVDCAWMLFFIHLFYGFLYALSWINL